MAQSFADRFAAPETIFSLPLPRSTITTLTPCGSDAVCAASRDGFLSIVDIFAARHAPQLRCTLALERAALCLAVDDDGSATALFVGTGSSVIERYVVTSTAIVAPADEEPSQLIGHGRGAVRALAASAGLLYSAGRDMTIRLWDCRLCVALAVLATGVDAPIFLSASGEARLLLATSHSAAGAISLWRLPTLLTAAGGSRRDSCLAPVVSAVLSGVARASGGLAKAADERGGSWWRGGGGESDAAASAGGGGLECLHCFALASNQVQAACLTPDGLACLSASLTGEMQVWDLERPREVRAGAWTFKHLGFTEPVRALASVGDAVVAASGDRTLRVARLPHEASAVELPPESAWATFAARRGETSEGRPPKLATGGGGEREVEDVLRGVEDAAQALAR